MRTAFVRSLRAHRVLSLIVVDGLAWMTALYLASALRLETLRATPILFVRDSHGEIPGYGVLAIGAAAVALHIVLAWTVRLHQGRSTLGGFEEIFVLVSVLVSVGTIVTILNFMAPSAYVARTTPVVATCLALILAAWPRGLWRILIHQSNPNRPTALTTPVIIVGAGAAGRQLVQSMQNDANQSWAPLGFVDDDKNKKHFRYRGIGMLGKIKDLERAAAKVRADTVVIAMPSAPSKTIKRVYEFSRAAGLAVKVIPSVDELLNGADVAAVRDIEPADLLGRHQIETDVRSIAGYVTGKRILVTGAGGSIGGELCRQLTKFGPAELMLLDRDESALHAVRLSMNGRADLESSDIILADIREADRMQEVFEGRRPQVVFHAAALKHVNMLEGHPSEAVKTNVIGTLNLLDAAFSTEVERFVNISTDKAADPENVLGYSKRIAEGLTAAFGDYAEGTYLSVRFGNVLGTRGSVLKTFASQIESGGPVTVTDPEVTRYFMTVHEAVQLVIQAAAIGRDGEALVLDMGAPVKIEDLARQMIDQSSKQIDIVYTGLKPGEKLHEVLFGRSETDERPIHHLVSHVGVPTVERNEVGHYLSKIGNAAVTESLRIACEEMHLPTARFPVS